MLWDVDYTLVNADGFGNRMYEAVFKDMFGRELTAVAPKAGRTDRAILLDTLALAGVDEPRAHVDDFLVAARQSSAVDGGRARFRARGVRRGGRDRGARRPPAPPVRAHRQRPAARGGQAGPAGLGEHLDLDVGAYGDVHEVRAKQVPVARQTARTAYGPDFGGRSTVLVGDTSLDVDAALATGARAVGVWLQAFSPRPNSSRRARMPSCPT